MKRLMKILAGLMVIAMMISVLPVSAGATAPPPFSFKDVSPEHPYYEDIIWGVQKGLISGYGDGTFKPDKVVSRLEFAIIAYRLWAKSWFTKAHLQKIIDTNISANIADIKKDNPNYPSVVFMAYAGRGLVIDYKGNFLYQVSDPLKMWELMDEIGTLWISCSDSRLKNWEQFYDSNSEDIQVLSEKMEKSSDFKFEKKRLEPIESYNILYQDYLYSATFGLKVFQKCNIIPMPFEPSQFKPNEQITRGKLMMIFHKLEMDNASVGRDMTYDLKLELSK